MIIHVKAKPNSSEAKIESFGEGRYLVYLTEPAENDRANIELIKILSKHLILPPGRLRIIRGRNDSNKIVEIR